LDNTLEADHTSSEKHVLEVSEKMKISAIQGIVLATLVLAVLGGVLQELNVWAQSADLTFMGQFKAPLLSVLGNSWVIIAVTWMYNIFLYLRASVLNVQAELKKYDITKFAATLTWFTGTLGAIFALAPNAELKSLGGFTIVILTIVIKEVQNVFGQTVTPTTTAVLPAPAPTPPAPITTYGEWTKEPDGSWKRAVYVNGVFTNYEQTIFPHATAPS
jgi:hypothetical protein